jgi:hypothetical protein
MRAIIPSDYLSTLGAIAVERKPEFSIEAESDPDLESLRQDSRFQAIIGK